MWASVEGKLDLPQDEGRSIYGFGEAFGTDHECIRVEVNKYTYIIARAGR